MLNYFKKLLPVLTVVAILGYLFILDWRVAMIALLVALVILIVMITVETLIKAKRKTLHRKDRHYFEKEY